MCPGVGSGKCTSPALTFFAGNYEHEAYLFLSALKIEEKGMPRSSGTNAIWG